MKYYNLPFKIYLNESFFANIEWYLYKYFHITRKYPCGIKKNKYNYCHQPLVKERVYLSKDKTECFCKVCGERKVLANYELDINNLWSF